MALRAPDIKDEHGWQILRDEEGVVAHATSRDKARAFAAGKAGAEATYINNGDGPEYVDTATVQPVAVEGTILPPTPKAPEELAAATAHEVNLRIKQNRAIEKALWVQLAADLYIFREGKMWTSLGYDTFEGYLADPEVEVNTRWAYDLIAVYRQLVIERGVSLETLMEMEVSKVRTVLPAIRREQVTVKQAFADAGPGGLARRDLETKYVGKTSTGGRPDTDSTIRTDREPQWVVCPTCNSRYQVDPETGERVR